MKATVLASLLAASFTSSLAVAQERIEDIAPKRSFAIIGVDNMTAMRESIKSGHLWSMWEDERMQELMSQSLDDLAFNLSTMEQDLDLEAGTLQLPDGPVGIAMFTAMNDELGMDTLGMIAMVDYGDEAKLTSLVNAMVDQMQGQGAEIKDKQIAGRTVYIIDNPQAEEDEWDQGGGGDPMNPMAMMEPMTLGLEKMYVCREGARLLLCSSETVLSDALGVVDGDDMDSVADSSIYRDALAQVGNGDGHAVVLIDNIVRVADLQPMFMMVGPMLSEPMKRLGFANMEALSLSVDLSPEGNTVARQRIGMLIDGEKLGLMKLMDQQPRNSVPAFVGADVTSYSHFNFDFAGLMDVIDDAVASLPFEVQQGYDDMMLQFGPDLKSLLNNMGREVHVATSTRGPVFAMKTVDAQKFEGALGAFAPQMQLEPRDFVGQTIYSGDFAPMAIGIGGGYAIIGDPTDVEMAMRAAGALNEEGALTKEQVFSHAIDALPGGNVVAWGFADSAAMLDESLTLAADAGAPDVDERQFVEIARDYLGPAVWQVRSVDNGFVMDWMNLLPPADGQ
ncbi:MAG: hypothetical protein ACR2GY_12635 [Phycisphaerales bacterium]